jgi:hypothetical protein
MEHRKLHALIMSGAGEAAPVEKAAPVVAHVPAPVVRAKRKPAAKKTVASKVAAKKVVVAKAVRGKTVARKAVGKRATALN